MATTVMFDVLDAIYTKASDALPDVLVYDGFQFDEDPGPDILMVGVNDGESTAAASTANVTQSQATAGTPRSRDETGSVNCWALSWNGNATQKQARDAVKTTLAAVENILRADPQLGIPRPNGQVLVIQIGDINLEQDQTDFGARALLTFTIQFQARI